MCVVCVWCLVSVFSHLYLRWMLAMMCVCMYVPCCLGCKNEQLGPLSVYVQPHKNECVGGSIIPNRQAVCMHACEGGIIYTLYKVLLRTDEIPGHSASHRTTAVTAPGTNPMRKVRASMKANKQASSQVSGWTDGVGRGGWVRRRRAIPYHHLPA